MKPALLLFLLTIITTSTRAQIITIGETNILSTNDSGNGNLLCAQNATLSQTAIIQSLSFYVTIAAGNLRMGIYDDSGPNGGPGVKQAETNSITLVTGWNTADIMIPVSLDPGTYWLAYLPSSNDLAFKKDITDGITLAVYPYTYGVMPSTFSTNPTTDPYHWSFYATLNTAPDTIAPLISNISVSSITQNSAIVTWNTNENSDSQIEYGLTDSYGESTDVVQDLVVVHIQPLSELAPSTLYHYRVKSRDTFGNLAISGDNTFGTSEPDLIPPDPPADLVASALSFSQVKLTWTASTDNVGVTGYEIERCIGSGCSDFFIIGTSSTNMYSDVGLSGNTSYSYRVRATDAGGNFSEYSEEAEVTTLNPPQVKVGPTGRYLVDQNDDPFMMIGDSPQALIANLSPAEAEYYFADRQVNGFNSMWVNLLCTTYTAGRPDGTTYDGIAPFTTPGDLATPNEPYFQRVDDYINLAAAHNLVVVLDPIETGGWLGTLLSNGVEKSYDYGVYLGNRYKNFPNIIWMSGNDFQSWSNPDDDAVVQAVALGIQSFDKNHIHTAELSFLTSSTLNDPSWAPIISLNAAYTYYPTYAEVLHAYNQSETTPVFMVEAHYELENVGGEMGTPLVLRRQEYWTMLSGATGQLYGNAYTWQFLNNWPSNIDTRGVTELNYMRRFFDSLPWYDLFPDQDQKIIIDGYGEFATSGNVSESDYATAAKTPDGKFAIAYLPTIRPVTIGMTNLSGPVTAKWFDPTDGTYSEIDGSPFSNTGTQVFTPAGVNSQQEDDWVLLLTAVDSTTSLTSNDPGIDQEIIIYPNPLTSSGILRLKYPVTNGEIVMYNMLGKEMMKEKLNGNTMEIDRGNLSKGAYVVSMCDRHRSYSKKIIIQ